MKKVCSRSTGMRFALAACLASAGIGLTATSASALSTGTYNELKNANTNQYCLDIRTEDNPDDAHAQLWTCTHPVVDEQEFILVPATPDGSQDTIRARGSRGTNRCLSEITAPIDGVLVEQEPCADPTPAARQSWKLNAATGEIINVESGRCLDAPQNAKGSLVVMNTCNGSISQRWFI